MSINNIFAINNQIMQVERGEWESALSILFFRLLRAVGTSTAGSLLVRRKLKLAA